MYKTSEIGLPLVAPSQAQKHVTVNEALTRLDALVQLRVLSANDGTPPVAPADGDSYIVPAVAVAEWAGFEQSIAMRSNGDWTFIEPKRGWVAWDENQAAQLLFDGESWVAGAVSVALGGASTAFRVIEFDHVLQPGDHNLTSVMIPSHSIVFGVSGRVIAAIEGSGVTSWKLGITGQSQQYGTGLGTALNSYAQGLTTYPQTFYEATPLRLGAVGGEFSGGAVRLAIHCLEISPPRAV